jgi:Transcriptional regulator containing PAS, AAA-type ATPase, and DNA-binding domains
MFSLSDNQETVQQVAEAIASVLAVEVTIIDENYVRLGATGIYEPLIGKKAPDNCLFQAVTKTGKPIFIEHVNQSAECQLCTKKDSCTERATMAHPIVYNHKVIGNICIMAFTEEQKNFILGNVDSLNNFIHKMSNLVVSDLISNKMIAKLEHLNKEQKTIIDTLDNGLICTDIQGNITNINHSACHLLYQTEEQLIHKNLYDLLPIKNKFKANKCEITHNGTRICFNQIKVTNKNKQVSTIITFSPKEDIINKAYHIMEAPKRISFDDILSVDPYFLETVKNAHKIAFTNSNVLIRGESGTGKELFARAIHEASSRSSYPFVAINCASIPDNLLESELFGYEAGAFSGANKGGKMGKFELADRGTILLDEIGDMPLYLQPKLLRVLQTKEIEKIGGSSSIPINVRIIAATNSHLEEKIKIGAFREDLFYRLNVIPLSIPPLRNRKEDIFLISDYLLQKYCHKLNLQVKSLSLEVKKLFQSYSWPGNVRELENVLEYAVTLTKEDIISISNLPPSLRAASTNTNAKFEGTLAERLESLEKEILSLALKKYGKTVEQKIKVAESLNISVPTLYRKIKKYQLED